jgi:hypothetical protein
MIMALGTGTLVMRSLSFGPPEMAIGGALALASAMWRPVAMGCGRGFRYRKVEAGHGTRRARYAAGSNGGAEADASELGFGCVDVAGAVLRRQSVQAPKTSPL